MQEEDFTEDTGRPSKTKQKEAMHELRDLGAELVELSVGQLKRIKLPENIYEAVRECQKITAHGARRRQVAVPRQADARRRRRADPRRPGLLRGESSAETARLHRLERLRTRLLEDEAVLAEIAAPGRRRPPAPAPAAPQCAEGTGKQQAAEEFPRHLPGPAGTRQAGNASPEEDAA
jgi:ribosome-associated protein